MSEFDFDTLLVPFLLTLFAGLSTGVGASLVFFTKRDNNKLLSIGLGFSAGVMIYVSFVEILAKSKVAFGVHFGEAIGEFIALGCFFGGILFAALIDRFIPEDVNPHELKNQSELEPLNIDSHSKLKANLKRTGLFTAIAIGIHNFPEGFATFIASIDSVVLGLSIAMAIAIHNIPEGMAVSLPIYHATGDKKLAFKYAFISGIAEPLGAIVGYFLLLPIMGEFSLGIVFGMVAGIMVYISFDELLPSARVYGNAHTTIFGIVFGMMVMAVSLVAFKI
ncbi:MAG: zinc transporter ZupT [Campylobacterales bacterium]|nr:zinc transporter ZupT [Campylobacterales bacterium]